MVLDKKSFIKFFPIIYQFGPQGHGWQDLCRRPLDIARHCYIHVLNIQLALSISCGSHGFREEFLSFSHYKSLEANHPWDVANLNLRNMVGSIYVGAIRHCYIVYTCTSITYYTRGL